MQHTSAGCGGGFTCATIDKPHKIVTCDSLDFHCDNHYKSIDVTLMVSDAVRMRIIFTWGNKIRASL
jgi:hypothetical protein